MFYFLWRFAKGISREKYVVKMPVSTVNWSKGRIKKREVLWPEWVYVNGGYYIEWHRRFMVLLKQQRVKLVDCSNISRTNILTRSTIHLQNHKKLLLYHQEFVCFATIYARRWKERTKTHKRWNFKICRK